MNTKTTLHAKPPVQASGRNRYASTAMRPVVQIRSFGITDGNVSCMCNLQGYTPGCTSATQALDRALQCGHSASWVRRTSKKSGIFYDQFVPHIACGMSHVKGYICIQVCDDVYLFTCRAMYSHQTRKWHDSHLQTDVDLPQTPRANGKEVRAECMSGM